MSAFGILLLICLLNLFEYTTPKIKKKSQTHRQTQGFSYRLGQAEKGFLNVKNGPLTSSRGNLGIAAQTCNPSSPQQEAEGRLPA